MGLEGGIRDIRGLGDRGKDLLRVMRSRWVGGPQINQNGHVIAVGQPLAGAANFAVVDRPSPAVKHIIDVIRLGGIAVQVETWMQLVALIGLVALMIGTDKPVIVQNLHGGTVVPRALWAVPDPAAVQITQKDAKRIGKPSGGRGQVTVGLSTIMA